MIIITKLNLKPRKLFLAHTVHKANYLFPPEVFLPAQAFHIHQFKDSDTQYLSKQDYKTQYYKLLIQLQRLAFLKVHFPDVKYSLREKEMWCFKNPTEVIHTKTQIK